MKWFKRCFLWIICAAFGIICVDLAAYSANEAVYDAHGKRDPFLPLVSAGTAPAAGLLGIETIDDVSIEGVVYDPQKGSVVIVNGSVLKEGAEVGNLKVVKVRSDGAVFAVNGIESFRPIFREQIPQGKRTEK